MAAVDHEANTSYCPTPSFGDESYDSGYLTPGISRTKQDMFDLTVWKLHSMNRPARRDASLRKSVLIFNLLRCLQQENSCDVEMIPNATTISDENRENRDSNNVDDSSCSDEDNEDEGIMDDDNGADVSLDAETRTAVVALSMIDRESNGDQEQAPNVSYQFSYSSGTAWSVASCRTAEPEMMDIDIRNSDLSSFVDDDNPTNQRSTDTGLITESYRLLENGTCVLGDQNFQFGRSKSYAGAVVGGNGEYRPFDAGTGFNLFA